MSTGGSSSHRQIKISEESLNICLTELKIEKARGTQLMNKLLQLQSTTEHDDCQESDTSDGENPSEPLAQDFSLLVKTINNCWMFHRESNATLRSPEDVSELQLKQLRCFFLLPEDAVLTKKQLTYWWIGHELINFEDEEGADAEAGSILEGLIQEGTIEQVTNKTKRTQTSKYRRKIRLSDSQLNKVGILRNEGGKQTLTFPSGEIIDKESKARIDTLFNRDVSNLSLTRDWVRQMRDLKVLHLGSWSGDKNHIEIDKLEFLEALKYMKKLRFISFKGVSRIISLSDEIFNVGDSLRILDLQDCPNLEVLPKRIGNLHNLTHLDLSECYLLEYIPKSIIFLTKLQVLEGFVIGEVDSGSSCKFKDLANHLGTTLKKLSIVTRQVSFPLKEDMEALTRFQKLLKLKMVWVRKSDTEEQKVSEETPQHEEETFKPELQDMNARLSPPSFKRSLASTNRRTEADLTQGLPGQLQKLEVQDIPQKAVNSLIFGGNYRLQNLKKLYIIGGDVSDITNLGKVKCEKVDTMKLKYLTKLHMSWGQLKASFPVVAHMEMVQCPFLTFFPCDTTGIWSNME